MVDRLVKEASNERKKLKSKSASLSEEIATVDRLVKEVSNERKKLKSKVSKPRGGGGGGMGGFGGMGGGMGGGQNGKYVIMMESDGEWDMTIKLGGERVPVVVAFYSESCGSCRRIAPLFSSLATMHRVYGIFVKVNIAKCRAVLQRLQIRSVPTFQIYVNGKVVEEWKGADAPRLKATLGHYCGGREHAVLHARTDPGKQKGRLRSCTPRTSAFRGAMSKLEDLPLEKMVNGA